MEIEGVATKIDSTDVIIRRDPGSGSFDGFGFIIYDGVETETIKVNNLEIEELETKRFEF